jgi:hypothetical protein
LKYWLSIIYLPILVQLGDDTCQQLIGWKIIKLKKFIYYNIYIKYIVINIINLKNNVTQNFGSNL